MQADTPSTDAMYFGPEQKPPKAIIVGMVLQYLAVGCSYLLLPMIVVSQGSVDSNVASGMVSIAMILFGLSVLLQSIKSRWIGAGVFATATPAPVLLGPSILAIKMGGLGLLATMTGLVAVVLIVFALLIRHMERFFPPELGALLIALLGIELGGLGFQRIATLPMSTSSGHWQFSAACICLMLILSLQVWGKGLLKLFGLLIGLVVGYSLVVVSGHFNSQHAHDILSSPWLSVPYWRPIHYEFSAKLLVPFIVASIICVVKIAGSLTAIQQAQNPDWKGSDMGQISRSACADAAVNVLAALFGSMGFNLSSSVAALTASTKVFSRCIAYPFAALFILMAFCPKLAYVCIFIPKAVVAAILIYLGMGLLLSGFRVLAPLLNTMQRRLIVGVSFMLGLSHEISPMFYQQLPSSLQIFTGSSIAVALVVALVMNFLFMLRLDDPDHMKPEIS